MTKKGYVSSETNDVLISKMRQNNLQQITKKLHLHNGLGNFKQSYHLVGIDSFLRVRADRSL